MKRAGHILILALVLAASFAAGAEERMAVSHSGVIHPEWFQDEAPAGAMTMPSTQPQEESEDEDDTSKEKLTSHHASSNYSQLLLQLFIHQQKVFSSLKLETETPPPRVVASIISISC